MKTFSYRNIEQMYNIPHDIILCHATKIVNKMKLHNCKIVFVLRKIFLSWEKQVKDLTRLVYGSLS